jgi:ParB-like chromosome segregation protein Spo0J
MVTLMEPPPRSSVRAADAAAPAAEVAAVTSPAPEHEPPGSASAPDVSPASATSPQSPPPKPPPAQLRSALGATGNCPIVVNLPLDRFRPETKGRARIDPKRAERYAEALEMGWPIGPAKVCQDRAGELWLFDGSHYLEAARLLDWPSIKAMVWPGERKDAMLRAAAANADHGQPRSAEDNQRAVELALTVLGADVSNRQVAVVVGLSDKSVDRIRRRIGQETKHRQQRGRRANFAQREEQHPQRALDEALRNIGLNRSAESGQQAEPPPLDPSILRRPPEHHAAPTSAVEAARQAAYQAQGIVSILQNLVQGKLLSQLVESPNRSILTTLSAALEEAGEAVRFHLSGEAAGGDR